MAWKWWQWQRWLDGLLCEERVLFGLRRSPPAAVHPKPTTPAPLE